MNVSAISAPAAVNNGFLMLHLGFGKRRSIGLEANFGQGGRSSAFPPKPRRAALGLISWVVPDRPSSSEIGRALAVGYRRGADLRPVATALYLVEDPSAISFLTLDPTQHSVAAALGFRT